MFKGKNLGEFRARQRKGFTANIMLSSLVVVQWGIYCVLQLCVYETVIAAGSCDSGWLEYKSSCYGIYTDQGLVGSMNNAIRFCRARGAHVVTLETPEENYFVQQALNHSKRLSRCFMGITDFWSEGEFQTLQRERIPYENFKDPDPDNGGLTSVPENCACLLANSGLWKDQGCTNPKANAFVCEKALYHRSSQGLEVLYGRRLVEANCQLESHTVRSSVECAARYLQSGVALSFNIARVLSGTTPNCHVMNCTPMDVSAVKADPDWILYHYPEVY